MSASLTVCVERLPVGRALGVHDGRDGGGGARHQKDVGLLEALQGRPHARHERVVLEPGRIGNKEKDCMII